MLQYAILTHLASEPLTGYDLSTRLANAAGSTWHASRSQIYAELGRLEADGLVDGNHVPQDGRPDKCEYEITPAGRAALVDWAVSTPVELAPDRNPAHVRLANVGRVPREVALAKMQETIDAYRVRLDALLRSREVLRDVGLRLDGPVHEHYGWALSVEVAIRSYEGVIASWEWGVRTMAAAPQRRRRGAKPA